MEREQVLSVPKEQLAPGDGSQPRLVNVQSAPIDYRVQGPEELVAAFGQNLRVVAGGNVLIEGREFSTDGVLGREARRINQRLKEISEIEREVLEGQKLYGGSVRLPGSGKAVKEPKAIISARTEAARIAEEDNRLMASSEGRLQAASAQIGSWRLDNNITPLTQTIFDNVLAVERFLEISPGGDNFEDIAKQLKDLKWDRKPPGREGLLEKVEDFKYGLGDVTAYETYKKLVWGYDLGGQHVPGLKDYQHAYAEAMRRHNQTLVEADKIIVRTREQVASWEAAEKNFRENIAPEAKQLKARLVEVLAAADYLQNYYSPNLDELINLTESIAEGVVDWQRYAKSETTFWTETRGTTYEQTGRFLQRLNEITDPARKLILSGVPQDIASMVSLLKAEGFSQELLPEDKKCWAEVVSVLLGQGETVIEEVQPKLVAADEEAEALVLDTVIEPVASSVEESPDPEIQEVDQDVRVNLDLASKAADLSLKELGELPQEQLVNLVLGGYLTVGQLASLEADRSIEVLISNLLVNGDYEGIKAVVISQVDHDHLPIVAVACISGVAKKLANLPMIDKSGIYGIAEMRSVIGENKTNMWGRIGSLLIKSQPGKGISPSSRQEMIDILTAAQISMEIWHNEESASKGVA